MGYEGITSDEYMTTIAASLVTIYDTFNITFRQANGTTSLEPYLSNNTANYVELDINKGIRLYYQVFITLSGIIANLLALVVTLNKRMRKHNTCLYMSAISGSDAVTLTISFVWWLGRYVDTTSVWSCRLVLFSFYYAIHFSVTLLVAMTVERFVAIRCPFWAHVHLTRGRSARVIAGVAVAILGLDAHNLFTTTMLVDPTTGATSCLFSHSPTLDIPHAFFRRYIWPWIDASVYSFFPLVMLLVFNPLIIVTVRRSATERNHLSVTRSRARTRHAVTEQQLTTMLLFVTFAFIILTGPMAVTLILEKLWDPPTAAHGAAIWKLWRTIVSNLMYTNHAINFILYSLSGQHFRRELRRTLQCGRGGASTESSDMTPSIEITVTTTSGSKVENNLSSIDTRI